MPVLFHAGVHSVTMGMDGDPMHRETSISKHAFFNLSHVSPLVFLYLLKECYSYGRSEIFLLFISEYECACLP